MIAQDRNQPRVTIGVYTSYFVRPKLFFLVSAEELLNKACLISYFSMLRSVHQGHMGCSFKRSRKHIPGTRQFVGYIL